MQYKIVIKTRFAPLIAPSARFSEINFGLSSKNTCTPCFFMLEYHYCVLGVLVLPQVKEV